MPRRIFLFLPAIGILGHKAARHSTDQSSRSSSDISALPTSTIAGFRVEHFVVGQEIDGFVISAFASTILQPNSRAVPNWIDSITVYIHLNGFYRYSYCRLTGKKE